jgi:hypothetical protein
MGNRTRLNVGVAIVLIVSGIVLPKIYANWLSTRSLNPIDMPVSLTRGTITTRDFYLNFTGEYGVSLSGDDSFLYVYPYKTDCMQRGSEPVKTHLRVFRNGQQIGETDGSRYSSIASFDADKKGVYRVEVDVLSDAGCLNQGHPGLYIYAMESQSYKDLYELSRWLRLIPIASGIGLLGIAFLGSWKQRRERLRPAIVEGDDDPLRWRPTRRFRSARRFAALPSFGLLGATVWSFILFVHMVYYVNRPVPRGIWVSALRSRLEREESPSPAPLIVRLEDAGPGLPPRLYVNSKALPWTKAGSWEGLHEALKGELKVRADWVVYIQGDSNLPWADAAEVAAIARELHAKVVLLTPETPLPDAAQVETDSARKLSRKH